MFLDKLGLVLTEMKEGASVSSLGNSLVSSGFFGRSLHHLVVITDVSKALVWNLLSHDQTVDESLLFSNLSLLFDVEVLVIFNLLGQELVLLSDLLSSHGQHLVLFVELCLTLSNNGKLLLSLFDLLLVGV